MSDGGGYGGDYSGKKPLKKRGDIITLWTCCNCRTQGAMLIESTPSCPFCYHYRCFDCPLERHRKRPDPLWLSDSPPPILSNEPRESPEVATSDSGTSLATPVAVGVAVKDLENANATDIYGVERFLMSLRPKRRLLGRGSKGFTRDEIFSALSKAVEGKQPLPLINALRQLAEATGASGSTHTAVKKSGAIPTLQDTAAHIAAAAAAKMKVKDGIAKEEEEERREILTGTEAKQGKGLKQPSPNTEPSSRSDEGIQTGRQDDWVREYDSRGFSPLPPNLPLNDQHQAHDPNPSFVKPHPQSPVWLEAQDTSPPSTSQVRTRAVSEAKSTLEGFSESEHDSSDSEHYISIGEDTESDDEQSAREPSSGRDLDPKILRGPRHSKWRLRVGLGRSKRLLNAVKQRRLAQTIGSDIDDEDPPHWALPEYIFAKGSITAQNTEQLASDSDTLAATITSMTNDLKQPFVDSDMALGKETSLLLEEALREKQETLPVGKRRNGTNLPESSPTDLGGKAKWTDMVHGDDDWKPDTELDGTKNTIPSADEESVQDVEAAKNSPPDNGKATAGVGFDAKHKPIGSEATIEALKECARVPVKDYALAVIDEDGNAKIYTSSSSTPYQDETFTQKISNEPHSKIHDSGKGTAIHERTVDEPVQGGEKEKHHELYGERDPSLTSSNTGYERGDGENGPLRIEDYLRTANYGELETTRGDKYRPKNSPSNGDAVLVSFMDGGKRPDIARRAGREPLASDSGRVHQESTQSFGEAIDVARDTIVTNRNTTPEIFFDSGETYSISKERATRLDASLIHVEDGSEKHDNQVISEELDPGFPSSYLGEKWRGGAYGPSDLEEDNKTVTHQQAAEPVRTTAELDQEYEENFRGGRDNQFFPCKYCPALQGDFGFWAFNHLKMHMKTKHNRELESESPIWKRKISINGRKYEKDDQQPGAADTVFDRPENEARVPREIDVEDQVAPLLGRQDQPTPPALHTLLPLQTTETSSSQIKVINSTGGHRLGLSRTDPWSSSGFVEEEEDEGWDRDEDNRDGNIRNEGVQNNIYTTSAPIFAPETISYEDGAIETKSSTARESLSKHYRTTTSRDSKSPTDWAKLKEPFSWKLDDEDRHETNRGSDSISSHSQNLNTIESELAEVAKMAKVYSTPGVRTEPADRKVDFEASIAAMRAETERGKAEDAQAAADNALLTAEAARDVFRRHDERLPKADSFLEAVVEEDFDPNKKRMFKAELDSWMQLFDAAEAMKKDAEDTDKNIQEMERATLQGLNIQKEATRDNSMLQANALRGMLLKQEYDAARLETDTTLAQQSNTSSQRSPMETPTDLVLPNASESHFSPESIMSLGSRRTEQQDDERSEISSRSVSSVASVASSIFSIITGSSMSSIIGPEAAAENLVQLLLSDQVIRPLCLEALIIVAHERFERNLRRLLGSFALELKKEARNSQEINAARFVKFRARNSAHIICNRLRPKEPMQTRKPEDKPVLPIEEFSDESDSDRSDDETNDLQQLEVFIKTSSALEVLRTNLRAFIYPQTQTAGPKPNEDMSKVPSDGTDGHKGVKKDERSNNESSGVATLPSQRSKLFSSMKALVKMQPRPVPEGRTRIAWKCKCGHKIEDDFIELQPGAAERYRQSLARANNTETSSQISRFDSISSTLSGGLSSLLTVFSYGSSKSNDPELPLHERSQPCNQVEHGNSNPEDPPTPPPELLYLLLCYSAFNESRFATRLLQLDLVALKAKSDKCLFKILRQNYQTMRSRWLRYISLRTLQSIKFVNFQMYKSELVDVRRTDVIPPPDDMDYRYAPAPPEVIPPIGERHLLHLFKHPEHAEDEPVCLDMFPKKLKEMLVCNGGVKMGWGIQFVEDWDWKKIWMIVFVIFGLGSAIVGVVWAVLGQNVQNAFAVAGYVVALSGVSMAFLQALLVM